eukprot:TRINITY_DN3484_c0_g1_i1.p1 TRINITY_DN3484_c0_g1~~TRINITY_DN3484_c0_g1_i1.p1  ORF type:complete len:752 (-),score=173.46 TRINITY_DN3484_c0_g1_i1:246-2441(-)
MDWSPPPRNWAGRDTIWPHDPRTGWSFCVMIPKWEIVSDARAVDSNPVVFYRVLVGIQSPSGITSSRSILRRFNDFLRLSAALKHIFPKKQLPPVPPKHSFLRINSSPSFIQERRRALEEWLGRLLLDIDISRSVPVASFLELEAAARMAIMEINDAQHPTNSSLTVANENSIQNFAFSGQVREANSPLGTPAYSYSSIDYGSDTTNEVSELETSRHERDHESECELDGASEQGQSQYAEQLRKNEMHDAEQSSVDVSRETHAGNLKGLTGPTRKERTCLDGESSHNELLKQSLEHLDELPEVPETAREYKSMHGHKLSVESYDSETSSVKGTEALNLGTATLTNSVDASKVVLEDGLDNSDTNDFLFLKDIQMILPSNDRKKIKRLIHTLQRRLLTTKTDMEYFHARWDQEIAAKEFLVMKVKDLESELENTQIKSKEILQQAVMLERDQVTQLKWDLEDTRRNALEMEESYKKEKVARDQLETRLQQILLEKDKLEQEVFSLRNTIEKMQSEHEQKEIRAKAEVKILAKELKLLRKVQPDIKHELELAKKEKSQLEGILENERQKQEQASAARSKLLQEAAVLRQRLQECSVNIFSNLERHATDESALSDAIELLTTTDNRIGLLLAEAQLLGEQDENDQSDLMQGHIRDNGNNKQSSFSRAVDSEQKAMVTETMVHRMLTDLLIDNAQLRKAVNSLTRSALLSYLKPESRETNEAPKMNSILNKFLEK